MKKRPRKYGKLTKRARDIIARVKAWRIRQDKFIGKEKP